MSTATEMECYVPSMKFFEALRDNGVVGATGVHHIDGCNELIEQGKSFLQSERYFVESGKYYAGTRTEGKKPFLIKYRERESWCGDDPIVRFGISPDVLNHAAAALGTPVILYSADIWATLPSKGNDPLYSQTWHRDPEGTQLIKAFLYLGDVGEDEGPLQYIAESHRGDWDLCAPQSYPTPEQFERLPRERVRTFCGKAGMLIMANTSGLHRGGYGTKVRLTAAWTYTLPGHKEDGHGKKIPQRLFQVPCAPEGATALQRFALGV
jgi:hypothetical protein